MKRILILSSLLILALTSTAQQPASIQYTPVSCLRSGLNPILTLNVEGKGDLRAYFRRTGTADWCMVSGINRGQISSVMLPAFEEGAQIEYFFLLLEGKQVMARSPQIYRATTSNRCGENTARHMLLMTIDCGDNNPGSIANALGAGYAVQSSSSSPATPFDPREAAPQ